MNLVYLDLHIHTSKDANNLNENYEVDKLINKINLFTSNQESMISLTDHNIINKKAYVKLQQECIAHKNIKYIVGVELSIRNFPSCDFYHCHFYFDIENLDDIDEINKVLLELYPNKMPSNTDEVPSLEKLIKALDNFDFLILPHGGQSHRSFDTSIPEGAKFDSVLEKNLYYNMFDGFTSRSNSGTEKTVEYFKRLGIEEVVNLITCTDNYVIEDYPEDKSKSGNFIPTWMFAEATYQGLRLSLSDSDRFKYQEEVPETWSEFIKSIKLENDNISMNVDLSPGLNVVIGASSSGKTLFAETLYNGIKNPESFNQNSLQKYSLYNINQAVIENPAGIHPHYISQNYIAKVIDNTKGNKGIKTIDIIKNVFKYNDETLTQIKNNELKVSELVNDLVDSLSNLKTLKNQLNAIPHFPRLITTDIKVNPIDKFLPSSDIRDRLDMSVTDYNKYKKLLEDFLEFSKKNLFFDDISSEIDVIDKKLDVAYNKSKLETVVRTVVKKSKQEYSETYIEDNTEKALKIQQKENLLEYIEDFVKNKKTLNRVVDELKSYNFSCENVEEESNGHILTISNELLINNEILLTKINKMLKSSYRVDNLDDIDEETFSEDKFSDSPNITFDNIKKKLSELILKGNETVYNIVTESGKSFDKLSPGWKTAIILDLVLGYEGDFAPIIIDQPEDNLASEYINDALIRAIKTSKEKRQIIIITHSATIPILGDAQNVILCRINEEDNFIKIESSTLEGKIGDKETVDHIVDITDGGKITVKKRIKKYNLKKIFKEEEKHETES